MVCKVAQRWPSHLVGKASSISSMRVYRLSDDERMAWTRAVECVKVSPYENYEDLVRPMGEIFRGTIRREICHSLKEMTRREKIAAILLQNCPLSPDLPNTPAGDEPSVDKGYIEELFLLGLCDTQGCRPYHDKQEGRGTVFPQLTTVKGFEKSPSSKGLKFGPHTEHVHQKKTIDLVDLFCIRGDPNMTTGLFTVENLIKRLPPSIVEGMKKPIFRMQTGPSWPHMKMEAVLPILAHNRNGDLTIRFNSDFVNRMVATNNEALRVLEVIKEELPQVEKWEVALTDGDCLTIHNQRAVHYRSQSAEKHPTLPWDLRRWVFGHYKMMKDSTC